MSKKPVLLLQNFSGICGGIISVTSFAALVAIYPSRVATVTALAETVLNGALAVGPFLGSVLYALGGFRFVYFVFYDKTPTFILQ